MSLAAAFDPMSLQLRQAENLSPDSTPRNTSHDGRWADIAIDVIANKVYEVQAQEQQPLNKDDWGMQNYIDETEVVYTNVQGFEGMTAEELDSVGSRLHDSGRCKPCAFFHTKGCNSAINCIFCHRCPAHEKQRRKRLRRQLCHSLLNNFDTRGTRSQGEARLTHPTKAGHSRMVSTDTTSTCSGWVSTTEGQFAHSRTTSTSSQAGASHYEGSDTMANLGYVHTPTNQGMYPNVQPQMMSPQNGMMQCLVAPMQPCNESWNESGSNDIDSVLKAQAMSPCAAGEMALSPVPACSLQCQEPTSPPSGMPMVQTQPAIGMQSPTHQSEPTAPFFLPNTATCEQQMQNPDMPSPVGYMTCGNFQYAIVPVPVQQYENGATYAVPATYDAQSQAMDQQQQQQQQWGACGPYEGQQQPQQLQYGDCMVSQTYQPEQQWAAPYETLQMANPIAVVNGSSQWW